MKKFQLLAAASLLGLLLAAPLPAQEPSGVSLGHYRVYAEQGETRALEVARTMEAAFALFNDFFRLEPGGAERVLRVRLFSARADYDAYLKGLIGDTRPDFVFISYRDPNRSELVGYERPMVEMHRSLLHYGLIQYLNAYAPNAPLWLSEGAAAYLEASRWEGGVFQPQTNYAWLEALKTLLRAGRLPLGELLTLDKARAAREIGVFYPMAWGLVQFLAESPDKGYNRLLWDSISALRPELSLAENSARVKARAFDWAEAGKLEKDFTAYILGLKTYGELVREGTDLYNASKLEEAEKSFAAALGLRADSSTAHYYLGLIAYQRKAYAQAAEHYRRAEALGAEAALIQYALGVSAFADKKYEQAAAFLRKARELNPTAYGEKADALLKRIETLK